MDLYSQLGKIIAANKHVGLTKIFGQMHITVSTDELGSRVLLKSDANEKKMLLNGVIYTKSGNLLCLPARKILKSIPQSLNLDKYRIFSAVNGTVINVYRHANTLCISTSRGMDVSNSVLFGDQTYRDIFTELLNRQDLSFDIFSNVHCYTFVISHPTYHWVNCYTLTFIGASDLIAKCHIQLPAEHPLTKLGHVERDRELIKKMGGLSYLRSEVDQSYQTFITRYDNNEMDHSPEVFGIVFRSITGDEPDYYLESNMMMCLRTTIYRHYASRVQLSHRKQKVYLSLYMNAVAEYLVHLLAPEALELFEKYEEILINMGKYITVMLEGKLVRMGNSDVWHSAAEKICKKIDKRETIDLHSSEFLDEILSIVLYC